MVVGLLSDDEVDRVFQALSDATRRDIVERVALDGLSMSTLARHYDMSFAAVQKHVSVLERAALVTKERRGREQIVRGDVSTVRRTAELLARYERLWQQRVDAMTEIINEGSVTS